MSTEVKETETLPSKVRIVATDKRFRKAPIFIAPFFDDTRKDFVIGKERYSATQNKTDENMWELTTKDGVYINNYDSFEISDKMILNLEDAMDKFIYKLMLSSASTYVAKDKKSVNPKYHRLYIENREQEADDELSEMENIFTAAERVRDMKESELRDLARVLKIHEHNVSEKIVRSNVMRTIKLKPTFVTNILNSATYKTESLRTLLLDGGVIIKRSQGYFTNPDKSTGAKPEFIAFTDADFSAFASEKKNGKLIEQWLIEAKAKLKEA